MFIDKWRVKRETGLVAAAIVVSLGLVVVLGLWLWSHKEDYNKSRTYQADQEHGSASGICIKIPPFSHCPAQEQASDNESRRSDDNLRAQQEMADWAFAVALFSGFGLIVSIGGIGLVYATFRKTGEAVAAANRTADDAREIGEAQVRAYLNCRSARFKRTRSEVRAILELENTGQSPASHIQVGGFLTMHEISGSPPRILSYIRSQNSTAYFQPIVSGGVVSEEIVFGEYDFPTEQDREIEYRDFLLANANEVCFNLIVKWRDVFDREHDFPVELTAIVDASPSNPRRKRARVGILHVRRDDPFRIDPREEYENYP